jgi:hypothetical protein
MTLRDPSVVLAVTVLGWIWIVVGVLGIALWLVER